MARHMRLTYWLHVAAGPTTAAILFVALSYASCTSALLYPMDTETRTTKPLDGVWKFRLHDAGCTDQQIVSAPLDGDQDPSIIDMPVPSSFNDVTTNATVRNWVGAVWYYREFFSAKPSGHRVVLRVGSAQYWSDVYVNSVKVAHHEGGHLPFEVDVTKVLNAPTDGPNMLHIKVNNTLTHSTLPPGEVFVPTRQQLLKHQYPEGYRKQQIHFDFLNYAGIHRSVVLYTTPVCHIADAHFTTTSLESEDGITGDAEVEMYSELQGCDNENALGNLKVKLSLLSPREGSTSIPQEVASVFLSYRQLKFGRHKATNNIVPVHNANLWGPGHPSLYTYQVTLLGDAGILDVYRLKAGIRTVKATEKQLLLNGKPVYLKGVNRHEDSDLRGKGFDSTLLVRDYNLMDWMNVNAFRTSHYPYDEQWLNIADERGYLVIDETPAVGMWEAQVFNPKTLQHHKNVLEEMYLRDKNHPSVIMWSMANEPASDIPQAGPYFEKVFQHMRSLDQTRPLTFVSCKDYDTDQAVQYTDVIAVNRYYGWYTDPGSISVIRPQLRADIKGFHAKFKKPFIMSEYGADTVPGMLSDPDVMFTESFQTDFIRHYHSVFDEFRGDFFIGELIWNYADFATDQAVNRVSSKNFKGLMTRQRQPKAAAFSLRQRYASIDHSGKDLQIDQACGWDPIE